MATSGGEGGDGFTFNWEGEIHTLKNNNTSNTTPSHSSADTYQRIICSTINVD